MQAVDDAGLDITSEDPYRVGVLLGNGNGGFPTLEENCRILADRGGMRMSPFFFPMVLPNMAAANVSQYVGARGYNSTATTACAASNNAIGEALQAIRHGLADVMLAGGAEARHQPARSRRFCRHARPQHPQRRTPARQPSFRR